MLLSSFISCFSGMSFKYFLNGFPMVPAAPITTGITYVLTFCMLLYLYCKVLYILQFSRLYHLVWIRSGTTHTLPPKKGIHTQLPVYIVTTRKLMRSFIFAYFILSTLQGYKLCNRVIYLNSLFICRVTQILFWLNCYAITVDHEMWLEFAMMSYIMTESYP